MRSGRLRASIVSVASLRASTIEAMWLVFSRYYADISRAKFDRDLAQKNDLILLTDSGDESVQGFSTLEVYERNLQGRKFVAVFSGDTVISEAYWGQSALHRQFVRYVVQLKLKHPFTPVFWFLISKGYKTYLLLSRNYTSYWPRYDRATPEWERSLIATFARDKYGDAYDKAQGVLRFAESEGRLKNGVAPIETGLMRFADIRFFAHQNPGHAQGDELCCLGKVDAGLWTKFTMRVARKILRGIVRRVPRFFRRYDQSSPRWQRIED